MPTLPMYTKPVVRIYKVPMDAFEGSEGSDEESDEDASDEEEEDDRGQWVSHLCRLG